MGVLQPRRSDPRPSAVLQFRAMTNPETAPGFSVEAADSSRRAEILETAAAVFARAGVQTSLKDVADACGILPGSLYHHFESKDAIVVELVGRYEDEIDDLAK